MMAWSCRLAGVNYRALDALGLSAEDLAAENDCTGILVQLRARLAASIS